MERIGPYRIIESLGAGGMAHVWRGIGADGVEVAVKVLDAHIAKSAKARARFYSEASTMATLDHPNVVRVLDKGEEDGVLWLAMELLDGGTADLWIRRHGPMPPRMAAQVVASVLYGLEAVHAAGIVHRDIKPSNVLLGSDGRIKITDFGIARAEDSELTRTGAMMGTWIFMAPEQRTNAKEVDARADVYAAGGTLWSLLAGHDPIDLSAQESIDTLPAPAELSSIVRRALRFNPEDRYASASVMRADLEIAAVTLPPLPEGGPPLFERLLDEAPELPPAVDGAAPVPPGGWRKGEETVDLPGWDAPAPKPIPTPSPRPASPPRSAYDPAAAERVPDVPFHRGYEIVEPPKPPVPAWTPTPEDVVKKPKPKPRSRAPVVVFAVIVLALSAAAGVLLSAGEPHAKKSGAGKAPPHGADAAHDTDTDAAGETDAAPAAGQASGRAPKGRLVVLSPGPAVVAIDGTAVGDAPVEVAVPPGFRKVKLHEVGTDGEIDLRVKVGGDGATEVCWSFARSSYCDAAETNAARERW